MNVISIIATGEDIDFHKNVIVYKTEIDAGPGLLVMNDEDGEHEMLLINQIHNGGPVTVTMKPYKVPAKKYKVGEVIAKLVLF